MYIQEKINRAFRVFCQDPSTENRDALIAECEELINVVLCTTPDWAAKDKDIQKEIRDDVMVLLMEFLERRKKFDNPSAFLFGFVKRSALNCLEARYPSKHPVLSPDRFPITKIGKKVDEKKDWTRFEDEMTELKGKIADSRRKMKQGRLYKLMKKLKNKRDKRSIAFLNLIEKELARRAECRRTLEGEEVLASWEHEGEEELDRWLAEGLKSFLDALNAPRLRMLEKDRMAALNAPKKK